MTKHPSNCDTAPERAATLWRAYRTTHSEPALVDLMDYYAPLAQRTVRLMAIYTPPDMDQDDLLQHALLGLWTALQRFDEQIGAPFEYYAKTRIRGAVRDALRRHDPLTRTERSQLKAMEDHAVDHLHRHNTPADDNTLAGYLGVDVGQVRAVTVRAQAWLSLDMTPPERAGDDPSPSLGETLADPSVPDPHQETVRRELATRFRQVFRQLPDRQQKILYLYYYEDLTLKEIGAILDLTEARICQIHAATLIALRTLLNRNT